MPNQQNHHTSGHEQRQGRRHSPAPQPSPPPSRPRAQGPARRELRRLLLRNRTNLGRMIIQMFTRGMQRLVVRLANGRTLTFARIDEGTQMDVVDIGDGTMVLTVIAYAELTNAEGIVIAGTGLEVTTREALGDEEDDDNSDYDGDGEDSGSGEESEESDSSTSNSSREQGEEQQVEGDSDAESDSDQEYYKEEIHGREVDIDLSYEGTLAFLAALATGGDNGEEGRRQPRVTWADEETSDFDSISRENRSALHAIEEHHRSNFEQDDSDDDLEPGNIVYDDGVFNMLVEIVQRYRRDPDELERNGNSEAAAAPLRRAGVEWRELVEHMRAEDA